MSRIDQRIALKHRKEKKNKKNNLVMFMCVLAALVICAVCVYGIYDISKKNHEQEVEIAKLEKEEALERQRAEEISGTYRTANQLPVHDKPRGRRKKHLQERMHILLCK